MVLVVSDRWAHSELEQESFSDQDAQDAEESDSFEHGVADLIRRTAHSHQGVEAIYASTDEHTVHFWTLIERRNLDLVRALIRDFQEGVIDLFVNTEHPPYELDFHIYYLEGKDPRELLPDSAVPLTP